VWYGYTWQENSHAGLQARAVRLVRWWRHKQITSTWFLMLGNSFPGLNSIPNMERFPRPSPSVVVYCKWSNTGGIEALGMRLQYWKLNNSQLFHCTIFMLSCYMHKARSNQSAPPIQSCLDDVECSTGKHCTPCLLETTFGIIQSIE